MANVYSLILKALTRARVDFVPLDWPPIFQVPTEQDNGLLNSPGTDAKTQIHAFFYPKRNRSAQEPISHQGALGTQQ